MDIIVGRERRRATHLGIPFGCVILFGRAFLSGCSYSYLRLLRLSTTYQHDPSFPAHLPFGACLHVQTHCVFRTGGARMRNFGCGGVQDVLSSESYSTYGVRDSPRNSIEDRVVPKSGRLGLAHPRPSPDLFLFFPVSLTANPLHGQTDYEMATQRRPPGWRIILR